MMAVPAAQAFGASQARVGGVRLGVQSWSFRDRSLDALLEALVKIRSSYCELGFNHVEPPRLPREELRKWRLSVPLDEFRKIRKKFDDNGIIISGYSIPMRKGTTPEEMERAFEMARALGVDLVTCTTEVSLAGTIDSFAARAKIRLALHNHSVVKPDELATPDDFMAALRGRSRYTGINLDIGHFVAAGFDPISFLEKNHARIFSLHLKDRKKNQGADVPFGEGDTPVREVLQLLKRKKYDIPAVIEWVGGGTDVVAEVGACLDYCRRVLA